MIQKLYKSHAQPFVRVVHGVPALWDSQTAATKFRHIFGGSVWSPCNRFIAITLPRTVGNKVDNTVDILDSVTLQRIQSLEIPPGMGTQPGAFAFSQDGRTLTSFITRSYKGIDAGFIVSWSLQTGGVVSAIRWKTPHGAGKGEVYTVSSRDGKVVALLSHYKSSATISINDVVSGVHMYDIDHAVCTNLDPKLEEPRVYKFWIHGESLRYAVSQLTGISIWEVAFAPGATPTEVEAVSIPANFVQEYSQEGKRRFPSVEFHPATCRLASIHDRTTSVSTLTVWDARTSKSLLRYTDSDIYPHMTFSSDGRFFACKIAEFEVYLWKESPPGYSLLKRLTHISRFSNPYLSPSGESIIAVSDSTVELWHTKSFTTTTSSTLAQTPRHTGQSFFLEFFPDRPLAVAARRGDRTVIVLDLNSGVHQLTIDTTLMVRGLRLIESTIVVMGEEKAIVWDIPRENFPPGTRMELKDSTRTIDYCDVNNQSRVVTASISLDFQYIALGRVHKEDKSLDVYCKNTRRTVQWEGVYGDPPELWFAPGERDIWRIAGDEAEVFTITHDALDPLKTIADIEDGSLGCPWGSSLGYKVVHDGWILGAGGKRLLMLPPIWRSPLLIVNRIWNGKFLALLHGGLPEPIILELEP